jgi:hypothetical protein
MPQILANQIWESEYYLLNFNSIQLRDFAYFGHLRSKKTFDTAPTCKSLRATKLFRRET